MPVGERGLPRLPRVRGDGRTLPALSSRAQQRTESVPQPIALARQQPRVPPQSSPCRSLLAVVLGYVVGHGCGRGSPDGGRARGTSAGLGSRSRPAGSPALALTGAVRCTLRRRGHASGELTMAGRASSRGRMTAMRSLAEALAAGPVVLDGGLSTELEARGHDVSSALWSARLLRDDPAAIVAAHAAFAAAGAQVATTASYQATVEGFAAAGVDARRDRAADRVVGRAGPGGRGRRLGGRLGRAVRRDAGRRLGVHRRLRGRRRRPRAARLPPAADGAARRGRCRRAGLRDRARGRRGRGADRRGRRARRPDLAVADHGRSTTTASSAPGGASAAADVFAMAAGVDEVVAVGVNCTDPAGGRAGGRGGRAQRASRSSSTRTAARAGTPSHAAGPARPGSRRTPSPAGSTPAPGWSAAAAASARSTSPRSPRADQAPDR